MKHLKSNAIGYIPHMFFSFKLSYYGFKILFCGILHGIFPFLFVDQSSKAIRDLNNMLDKEHHNKNSRKIRKMIEDML